MGLYAEVTISCPDCNACITLQSRAGDHGWYTQDSVPKRIAESLNGEEAWCDTCNAKLVITTTRPATLNVPLYVVKPRVDA